MKAKGLAIIGGGNLGQAILNGLLKSKPLPFELHVSKRNASSIAHLTEKGIQVFSNNVEMIQQCRFIILAVKPYDAVGILKEIAAFIDPSRHILISVVTGLSIDEIAQHVPAELPVFRAMPNTATDIAQSISCISCRAVDEKHKDEVSGVFRYLGETLFIKEELMEAATVLGACGIAYVLRFMRSMVQGGIQIGFDAQTASLIVNQVVRGAAELLIERKAHPEHEIDKVTTPKGCTIVGLNEMEHNGFSSSLIKGISASYKQIEK